MLNVLLLVYDCLRLDYFEKRMPRVQRILKGPGWHIFKKHWSVAHCSDPNFSTLLGGQPPWVTRINTQMGLKFEEVSPYLLPKVLADGLGYDTWAIEPIQVPRFYHMFHKIAWHETDHISDLSLQAVRAYTETDKPFFGMIRAMDTHYPYFNLSMPTRGEGGEIEPLYRKAVRHVDHHATKLIRYILKNHPNTMIILCADHGELLGEHGVWDHLYTLYNILTHVPCAIYLPGTGNRVHESATQHVDIYPTVLNAVGVDSPIPLHGVSLIPAMVDKKVVPSRTFWLQGMGAGPLFEEAENTIDPGNNRALWRHSSAIVGDFKVVVNQFAGKPEQYVASHAYDYNELGKQIVQKHKVEGFPLPALPVHHVKDDKAAIDSARQVNIVVLERLRMLGYA